MRACSRIFSFLMLTGLVWQAQGEISTQVVEELSTEKKNLVQKEEQKRNLLGELYRLTRDMKKIQQEKGHFEVQQIHAKRSIDNLTSMTRQLSNRISLQKQKLRSRLKLLSRQSQSHVLEMMMAKGDPSVRDRAYRVLTRMTERDFVLLKSYQKNILEYERQQKSLRREDLKLTDLKKSVLRKQEALSARQKDRNTILGQIDKDRLLHFAKLQRLRSQMKDQIGTQPEEFKHADWIESALEPSFFEQKGLLEKPVEKFSSISEFGSQLAIHPKVQAKTKGLFFQTVERAPVRTISQGQVVFSGALNDLENAVIVSHGDHYYSVYGSLENIKVKMGEKITKNTVLGEASKSLMFLNSGVYFEIRHFSEAIDPIDWLNMEKKKEHL